MALEASVTHIADLNKAWPVGADPKSSMDEHLRNLKTALLNDFPGFTGTVAVTGTDGGAANAYTLTPATALPGYSNRMLAVFAPTVANTGASTLNVSGLGVKPIVSVSGAALVSGDLAVGTIYLAAYDGTSFRLTSITKNYADQLAFSSSLPAQAGNAGRYVTTDGTAARWESFIPPQTLRSARTANTIIGKASNANMIDITSGTFTQTFDAAATLGDGWYCWLRNSGTGDITLDPNGTETIDGLTTFIMYPGEARLVQCDGVALRSVVLTPFSRTFPASGNFIKPPGYSNYLIELWGGGGGGGSGRREAEASAHSGGAGGGGGGYISRLFEASSLASSTSVVIGAGGTGGAAATVDTTDGNAGTAGGDSNFGPHCYALRGNGGAAGSVSGGAGGTGGTANSATTSDNCYVGGSGGSGGNAGANAGAGKPNGGAGGGGGGYINTGAGAAAAGGVRGLSAASGGAAGTSGATATAGAAGTGFAGGGGGGSALNGVGGAGGNGGIASGGGGGGASDAGFNSGVGGNGGAGQAIIMGIV